VAGGEERGDEFVEKGGGDAVVVGNEETHGMKREDDNASTASGGGWDGRDSRVVLGDEGRWRGRAARGRLTV
jgi:hypothetical protein